MAGGVPAAARGALSSGRSPLEGPSTVRGLPDAPRRLPRNGAVVMEVAGLSGPSLTRPGCGRRGGRSGFSYLLQSSPALASPKPGRGLRRMVPSELSELVGTCPRHSPQVSQHHLRALLFQIFSFPQW